MLNLKDKHQLNGKSIVKQAEAYFKHHPTCYMKESNSEEGISVLNLKKATDPTQKLRFNISSSQENEDSHRKKSKYITKNPYLEDTEIYDLEQCISEKKKPTFGYPLLELDDTK